MLTEYQKELINFYSYANSHIDTIDRRVLHYLLPITSSNWGQYVLERMNNITIINPANAFIGGFNYISRYPNISLKACIQYGDLKLDKNSLRVRTPLLTVRKVRELKSEKSSLGILAITFYSDIRLS